MTNLERLHELMINIIENVDKEENLVEFKRLLKEKFKVTFGDLEQIPVGEVEE